MDKEKIEERLKTLEAEREQVKSTLLAYEGAIQDCKYWLTELGKVNEQDNAGESSKPTE